MDTDARRPASRTYFYRGKLLFVPLRVVATWAVACIFCTTAASESSLRTDTGVVLKSEAGRALITACRPFESIDRQWNPDRADLATLDAALLPALASALKSVKDNSNPAVYFRQYAGGFYEGDHIIYMLGFHRSYNEALPENAREYWRSGPVRGGPGHTRFWCAYWVKETKHLIETQENGSAIGVRFVGSKATISMEPRGVATIGPIKFQVPEGHAFQGSRNEGDAVVGNWLDESGGAQTRLELRVFDVQSVASHSTPEEIVRLTESCLQQFLGGINKRRTNFQTSPTRHLSLAAAN